LYAIRILYLKKLVLERDHHDHTTSERGRGVTPPHRKLVRKTAGQSSPFQATKTSNEIFIPLLGIPPPPGDHHHDQATSERGRKECFLPCEGGNRPIIGLESSPFQSSFNQGERGRGERLPHRKLLTVCFRRLFSVKYCEH